MEVSPRWADARRKRLTSRVIPGSVILGSVIPGSSLRKSRSGAPGYEGQIQIGLDPRIGPTHIGDGVHAMHGRGHDPGVAFQALLDGLWLPTLEGHQGRWVAD